VDDMSRFIGIVRRSDIIDYCERLMLAPNRNAESLQRKH